MSSSTKNWVLLAVIVLVLVLCYTLAISKTMDLRREYKTLSTSEAAFKDAPKQLAQLGQKQRYFDSVLIKMNLGNTAVENDLLRVLNREAEEHKLKVLDFNEPHVFVENESKVNTFDFTLEGGYNDLLQAIYALEQKSNFGEIVHLQMLKKRDYRSRKDRLSARVFIRYLE